MSQNRTTVSSVDDVTL